MSGRSAKDSIRQATVDRQFQIISDWLASWRSYVCGHGPAIPATHPPIQDREDRVKMASRRVGWVFVIGFGALNGATDYAPRANIWLMPLTGYVTFKPAFEARALEKLKEELVNAYTQSWGSILIRLNRERLAAELGPDIVEIPTQQMEYATIDEKEARKGRNNIFSTDAWSQDDGWERGSAHENRGLLRSHNVWTWMEAALGSLLTQAVTLGSR